MPLYKRFYSYLCFGNKSKEAAENAAGKNSSPQHKNEEVKRSPEVRQVEVQPIGKHEDKKAHETNVENPMNFNWKKMQKEKHEKMKDESAKKRHSSAHKAQEAKMETSNIKKNDNEYNIQYKNVLKSIATDRLTTEHRKLKEIKVKCIEKIKDSQRLIENNISILKMNQVSLVSDENEQREINKLDKHLEELERVAKIVEGANDQKKLEKWLEKWMKLENEKIFKETNALLILEL